MRPYLLSQCETDLRAALRGATDAELILLWAETMRDKPAHGIDSPGFRRPDRAMSAIGG